MLASLGDGIRRVNRAPAILAGVWAMTLLASLPLAAAMRGALADHLGGSLAADSAASGVNYDWMQEFADQTSGFGATFKPTIIGFGAVLDNLSAFMDDTARPIAIVGAASAYIVLWIFVAGGILDRYARERPTYSHGFFSACGTFFFRFLRLAAAQWVVYAFLFAYLHRWLFDTFYPRITHEVNVERTAFLVRLALYAVFGILVAAAAMIFDYAKVRAVVEDRRSMLGAIRAALGFIQRNYASAVGLFLVNFVLFALVVALYAIVAPGAWPAGAKMWIAAAIGQLYIAARLWVKLVFWASETALFQSRLAHAGYISRPAVVWPDAAGVEAIRRT
jgi:hypothetical protein